MTPSRRKPPPRRRNLAAKALGETLFRPRVFANPNAYKRRKRFVKKPVDELSDDRD